MTRISFVAVALPLLFSSMAYAAESDSARPAYERVAALEGEWALSPADKQEGKATQHKVVAPLVSAGAIGMSFRLIGRGTTVQETLLPRTKKEMVTMYHCGDSTCTQVKATHYCVKMNQPELLADLDSSGQGKIVYGCDMSTDLCKSAEDHVHQITHELSADGSHLKTTYSSYKDGKNVKDSIYHFDRAQ